MIESWIISLGDLKDGKSVTDVSNIIQLESGIEDPLTLLFQAGYLTVARVEGVGEPLYFPRVTNLEVKEGIISLLHPLKPF
ncbi:MAG: hypothetical protein LBR53_01560 [Deltaproteobacteria bacterium]|jgi:hypothetical protein|nr:hypothetical protein [Deltaproteobacteria bacterium]